jgi:hypothetical protein
MPNEITRDSAIRLISGPPAINMTRRVRRRPRLGGLLNFYQRTA